MHDPDIRSHCSAASTLIRVGRVLVTCALVSMLAACGTGFVYNRLDWLSRYFVSSQVTLDDAQSRALQSNLDSFFAWHRRSELPRYATFLDQMANDAARPVTLPQLEAGQREVEVFMRDSVAHGAPSAARWLSGLRPEQVDELFANFAEKDRKVRAQKCDGTPAERRAKRTHQFIDNVENWTGRLSRAQREMIASRYATLRTDECDELTARERSRIEFRALVDRYRSRPEFAARIAEFLLHPENRRNVAYREAREADRARFLRMLADINHSLTPEQRAHTIERLRLYAREMRGLAAQPT
jgi:uncharacterized protein DUF6279